MPISRRDFLKSGAAAIAGFTIAPSSILGKSHGHISPTDKLNIGVVGIGGIGHSNINAVKGTENIVALCDVNWDYAKGVFDEFPKAKRFWDYRKMYEEMGKSMDAVIIATADHTHAIITADAMTLGKHVYCQKPLTHSVYESRLLTKLAKSTGVATQMGNQGASNAGTRKAIEWLWNGEIGEVKRVDCFTDRPIWPQGLERPTKVEEIPSTLNWESFIGPAPMRPYNSIYTPWNFRGWWDFGTGAMGDMACHIMHVPFKGLKLGYPTKVEASSTNVLTDSCPSAEMIHLTFPARENMAKLAMPEVDIRWYDGGFKPERPEGLPAGFDLNVSGGCSIFYGTKDIMIAGTYGKDPILVSGRKPEVPHVLREITVSHQQDWIRACKEDPDSRIPSASDFSEAGPFVEMVDLGVAAVRLQALNQVLEWDGQKMEFTNIPADATIKILEKDGFSIKDGHPTFKNKYTDPMNAREFAASLIKRQYHNGYELPEMPE